MNTGDDALEFPRRNPFNGIAATAVALLLLAAIFAATMQIA